MPIKFNLSDARKNRFTVSSPISMV